MNKAYSKPEAPFTEKPFGQKHRGPGSFNPTRMPNKYLDPSEYSRYSFTSDFLSSAEEIIESIECLENYYHGIEGESIITILTRSLSSYNDKGKELKLIKYILETGIEEASGTQCFIVRPGLSIPIRHHWIDDIFGNDMFELEQYIKAGLIQQHLSIQATAIREILQKGIIDYIANTAFDYDTIETLIKHLLWLYDTVDEDELEAIEMELYKENFYSRLSEGDTYYDQPLVDRLDIVLQYHTIETHLSLKASMTGEKLGNPDIDTAHNVIHGYLRLWHKEDTTQKDI